MRLSAKEMTVGGESRQYLAELIGTFVLVFVGVGTAVMYGGVVGGLGVGLAFGLALMVMVYTIGPISGCHINPAVTLGALLTGKIESKRAIGYVIAQVIGAVAAALLLLVIARDVPGGYDVSVSGFAANGYSDHSPAGYGLLAALIVETVLTALLVFTVLGVTHRKASPGFAGIAIGLVLTATHLVSVPITNTSINPARSIASALIVRDWALSQLWVFIAAPLLGAVVAVAVFKAIQPED